MRVPPASRVLAGVLLAVIAVGGCAGGGGGPRSTASFRTEDGFRLSGRIFGAGPRTVVLAHMFPADQTSWFGFAGDLANSGYQVLTFDFRGYGGSQGRTDVAVIDRDVRAAVRYMAGSRRAARVVLVGASMGGTASLAAAAGARVDGVATLSAPERFMGLDASDAVQRVVSPKLFVAARGDAPGAAAAATLFRLAAEPRRLEIVAGDEHGMGLLDGRRAKEVQALVKGFIAEASE